MTDLRSAFGGQAFDSNRVEPSAPMELMPKHWATAQITESEMKPTGGGAGAMLVLTFTLLAGPFAGRKVWTNLNLVNKSEKAVEIAQRELSAVCRATNRMVINDSTQLHNIPLDILIDIEPGTPAKDQYGQPVIGADGVPVMKYKDKNVTAGYAYAGEKAAASGAPGGAPSQPIAAAPAFAVPAQPAPAAPAWTHPQQPQQPVAPVYQQPVQQPAQPAPWQQQQAAQPVQQPQQPAPWQQQPQQPVQQPVGNEQPQSPPPWAVQPGAVQPVASPAPAVGGASMPVMPAGFAAPQQPVAQPAAPANHAPQAGEAPPWARR